MYKNAGGARPLLPPPQLPTPVQLSVLHAFCFVTYFLLPNLSQFVDVFSITYTEEKLHGVHFFYKNQ